MNSEDRTTILPATGRPGPGGRSARRAAERRSGHGRRRRRGGAGPVVAVVAAVAGTGVIAALTGAGYAVYRGEEGNDTAARAVSHEPLVAAEAGDRNGIQVPGAGAAAPAAAPVATDQAPMAGTSPTSPVTSAAPAASTPGRSASGGPGTASAAPHTPAASTAPGGAAAATGGGTDPQQPSAPASAPATPDAPATATATATAGAKPSTTAPRPSATTKPGGSSNGSIAQQVVDLVNVQRSQAGCGPLTVDARLTTAAQVHSDDMADRSFFDHASPEGYHADHRIEAAGYRWSTWGENIARGQKDPAAVMESWMNSPGHRANILNCSFKQIGVGVRTGSGGPWWTQVFAAPS
ncbi:CAP domain-containing protein [Kitasatospora sp. NPDC058032]|uniref:CAP domain-containing protein n=1 Tax=Kitasatospora sp. NPDC058032 TaxID=3346307 RepID=UPI0036DB488F